ncbi:MAG: enoyl-CoA hydratase/isomerase family protein [Rhizobiales bacterium]|nr:enoyl-CoA hydratase/isomerase family protein [Hyphomicrobiales bacterium]
MRSIKTVAVIGAGVMGAGIAAHFANAGIQTLLLDLTKELAKKGVQKQKKVSGFMMPEYADRVECGKLSESFDRLSKVDWIVEAIIEDVEEKQKLYRHLDEVISPNTIVSSNTSTIPTEVLLECVSDNFKTRFLITHFFNPPRHMRLLEIVRGEQTSHEVLRLVSEFADYDLGKKIVVCNDTPGFIANRIGTYWIAVGIAEAIKANMKIEEVDQLLGKPFGIPKTAIFGLTDLIGVDLLPTLVKTLQGKLNSDAIHEIDIGNGLIETMIECGMLGRKAGKGFYKRNKETGSFQVIDLRTGEYRSLEKHEYSWPQVNGKKLRLLFEHDSQGAQFAASVMLKVLNYAASLIPEIADSPKDVDDAMCFGYGWSVGPFQMIDDLGVEWVATAMKERNLSVPHFLKEACKHGGIYFRKGADPECLLPDGTREVIIQPNGVLVLKELLRKGQFIKQTKSSRLYDLKDGVACLELNTKMNAFDFALFEDLERAIKIAQSDFKSLVITGHQDYFSAGANLKLLLELSKNKKWDELELFLKKGQGVFDKVKYSSIPVVGAASGFALGGGGELLLHCDAIQAHAELKAGLVETKVGLLPGWGGVKELILRFAGFPKNEPDWCSTFETIIEFMMAAKVSNCAEHARSLGLLSSTDFITMNKDRLISDAKETALSLSENYNHKVPKKLSFYIEDKIACSEYLENYHCNDRFSCHERQMVEALCNVLAGSFLTNEEVMEADVFDLERESFLKLVSSDATMERISHMILTGKALRN